LSPRSRHRPAALPGLLAACGKLHRIQDQHDFAGAQHRRSRQPRQPGELRTDVLDHDFLVAQHFVDVDRDVLVRALQESTGL
jgi:hypothetical protein